MTNRGRVATPVVLLILGIYAISVAPAAAGLLETFDKSLRTTKDVTAVFTQTRHSPLLEEPIEADGKLWIRFPGDVRFEYETPDPMTLLKHADTTWLYVPALEQVQKSRASAAGVPMGWILGSSVEELKEEATIEVSGDHIVVRPLPENPGPWQRIEISYGSAKGFPSRYTIYEESGEVVDIRLRQVKRNTGVKAGRFSAEWPPGIEIITLGE
jgi:outer membrane lipoprotein carrier protein